MERSIVLGLEAKHRRLDSLRTFRNLLQTGERSSIITAIRYEGSLKKAKVMIGLSSHGIRMRPPEERV